MDAHEEQGGLYISLKRFMLEVVIFLIVSFLSPSESVERRWFSKKKSTRKKQRSRKARVQFLDSERISYLSNAQHAVNEFVSILIRSLQLFEG